MKLLSYLAFLCFLESVVLGAVGFALDPRSKINRLTALSNLAYSLWALGMTFAYGSDDPAVSLGFYQFSFWGSLFVVPLLLRQYMLMISTPSWVQGLILVPSVIFSVSLLIHYTTSGFYYASFVDGPWGNIGVPDSTREHLWAVVYPYVSLGQILIVLGLLFSAAARSPSRKLQLQLRILIPAVFATCGLYFLAWLAEELGGLPNTQVLCGALLMAANFWLIARYRFLKSNVPLLENHLVSVVQEATFLLDAHGRILGGDGEGQEFASLLSDPTAWRCEWMRAENRQPLHRSQPALIDGKAVVVSLVPHFNRFGDFVGGVVLVGPLGQFDENTAALGVTPREKAILVLLLEGCSHLDIADRLNLSPGTVKRHSHNLLEKTGTSSRVSLLGKMLGPLDQAKVARGSTAD